MIFLILQTLIFLSKFCLHYSILKTFFLLSDFLLTLKHSSEHTKKNKKDRYKITFFLYSFRSDCTIFNSLSWNVSLLFLSKYISVTKIFPLIFFVRMSSGFQGVARSSLVCASCFSVIGFLLFTCTKKDFLYLGNLFSYWLIFCFKSWF